MSPILPSRNTNPSLGGRIGGRDPPLRETGDVRVDRLVLVRCEGCDVDHPCGRGGFGFRWTAARRSPRVGIAPGSTGRGSIGLTDYGASLLDPRRQGGFLDFVIVASVLVVDDDTTVAEVVVGYLQRAGHAVIAVADGRRPSAQFATRRPDLIVLDLMLPRIDGLEVCRRVRADHPDLPVIMLTALGEEEDRIAGLEVGADDYVTKPFSPRELALRVDSVLRRTRTNDQARTVLRAERTVDTAARRATRDGEPVAADGARARPVDFLLAHPGRAFTRASSWRGLGLDVRRSSTVTVHVRRLREKIEDDPTNPTLIKTVWGVGYLLEASA